MTKTLFVPGILLLVVACTSSIERKAIDNYQSAKEESEGYLEHNETSGPVIREGKQLSNIKHYEQIYVSTESVQMKESLPDFFNIHYVAGFR